MSSKTLEEFVLARNAEVMENVHKAVAGAFKGSLRCCVNCAFFEEKSERCLHEKAGGARPPARVITFGCGMFEGRIPF